MARSTFEPRTFAVNPDGIIELFINAKYMPIVAAPYDGDELRVDYYTSPEYPYDAHIEDGIVIIECPQNERASGLSGMFNMFMSSLSGINWQQLTIKVYVPRSYYGMLNLCTSCASISAHSLELHSRLHAQTSAAMIDVRGVIATTFMLATTSARIYAENAAACGDVDEAGRPAPLDCTISSTNGAVELRSFSTLGSLDCRTTNGLVQLHDVAIQGTLNCTTTNASIRLENVSVQDCAWVKTSNGSIKTDRLLARDISMETSNATIKGTIVGRHTDFTIDTHTSNGKCRPSRSRISTGRTLTAHTSNGNIGLDFVD